MKKNLRLRNNEFSPDAVHPGEFLADELRARKIKQKDLAEKIKMNGTILNEIIKGKRRISIPLALKLERALGISAETWLNLQQRYEKQIAHQKTKVLLSKLKVPQRRHLSLIKSVHS
jgi:addiction module HigA family antidote